MYSRDEKARERLFLNSQVARGYNKYWNDITRTILLIIETLVGYSVQCKMCNIRNWMIVSPLREAPEFARSFLQIFTTTTKFVKKLRRILMKSIPFPKINSVHVWSDPKAPFPQNSSFEKKKDAHTSLRGTQPSHLFQIARTRAPRKR